MVVILLALVFLSSLQVCGMEKREKNRKNRDQIQQPPKSLCTLYGEFIKREALKELTEKEKNNEGFNEGYTKLLKLLEADVAKDLNENKRFDRLEYQFGCIETTMHTRLLSLFKKKKYKADIYEYPSQKIWDEFLNNISRKIKEINFWVEQDFGPIKGMSELQKLPIDLSVILFGIVTGMRRQWFLNHNAFVIQQLNFSGKKVQA
jgi:hypothetical protein